MKPVKQEFRILILTFVVLTGFLGEVPLVFAQGFAQERRQWVDSGTPVSDDPRRVPVAPGVRGPDGALVLRGGWIFDGTGAAPELGTLLIERNQIAAILPPQSTNWPAAARVIDVSGMTVMPGLIDMHTHLAYPEPDPAGAEAGPVPLEADDESAATLRGVERLRFYIESGITSVRDVASRGAVPFRLKTWVAQGRIPGPRVFPAGRLITATGGHGTDGSWARLSGELPLSEIREASGPDDWREAVREQFKHGADVIKIASHFSREEASAAIQEAHALGLKVTCDCETFYIQWAVEAGVDCIEHPLPRTDQTIRLMAKRHVDSIPTLVPYVYLFDIAGGYFDSTSRRFSFSKEADLQVFRRMKQAGIRLGVGTDMVGDGFRYLPNPYITELKQFVAGGYSTREALGAATRVNAEILDMGDKLGTLLPGRLADVLVVKGRPDLSLDDLANVSFVIRDGSVIVENGRVFIAPHRPVPGPIPRPGSSSSP